MTLLSRDEFREKVFARDRGRCVLCAAAGQDAHHILDRRLWPDGGYYLDNGATVCGPCHLRCERTEVTVEQVREAARIQTVRVPDYLHPEAVIDKWGNPFLPSGRRALGPLGFEESVRKILAPVWHEFTTRVKAPRTLHLPWSPCADPDDRFVRPQDLEWLRAREVVVLEKLDGENTTLGPEEDYVHARSTDGYPRHPSRSRMRARHAALWRDIPPGFRVCGENVDALHSAAYHDLCADDGTPDRFFVFSIWDRDQALGWDETALYARLLGLSPIPELYRGPLDEAVLRGLTTQPTLRGARRSGSQDPSEGYVVRPLGPFRLTDFPRAVLKCRVLGVTSPDHWTQHYTPNCVRGECPHR